MNDRTYLRVALLTPVLILLSACTMNITVDVAGDGSADVSVDLVDTGNRLTAGDVTCSELLSDSDAESSGYSVEDLTTGGQLHCRATSTEAEALDVTNNSDGTITVAEAGDATILDGLDTSQLDLTVTFHMPGTVTKADEGAVISGSTVTYTGTQIVEKGYSITSTVDQPVDYGAGLADQSTRENHTTLWSALGILTIATVGLVIFFISRARDREAKAARIRQMQALYPTGETSRFDAWGHPMSSDAPGEHSAADVASEDAAHEAPATAQPAVGTAEQSAVGTAEQSAGQGADSDNKQADRAGDQTDPEPTASESADN